MIVGIGIDLCDIERIQKILNKRQSHFFNKLFNNDEIENFINPANIAGRFATKEAFYKACNSLGLFPTWKDISILNNKNGAPYILIKNEKLQQKLESYKIWVSISHERKMAISIVIIEQ